MGEVYCAHIHDWDATWRSLLAGRLADPLDVPFERMTLSYTWKKS
jgi:hypothetical protein